jgi:low temperature requirement protein LtrA
MQWQLTDSDSGVRRAVARWTIMSSLGLVAVIAAVFLDPQARMVALAVAAALDVLAATRAGGGVWELFVSHFTERHGLIVIIALGESLIAAGATAADAGWDREVIVAALLAVIAACALWWTYFGWAKDVMEERFNQMPMAVFGRFARNVYSFGHFPIIAGVVGFAVAIEEAVAHPDVHLEPAAASAMVLGVTLFVGGTGLALWMAGARPSVIRLAAIILMILVGALSFGTIAAWAAIGLTAVIFTALAVLEPRPKFS